MADPGKMAQLTRGALRLFTEARKREYAVGMVGFAHRAQLLLGATCDAARFEGQLKALEPYGRTAMAQALRLATRHLRRRRGDKVILLVTDGMPNSRAATLEAARLARGAGHYGGGDRHRSRGRGVFSLADPETGTRDQGCARGARGNSGGRRQSAPLTPQLTLQRYNARKTNQQGRYKTDPAELPAGFDNFTRVTAGLASAPQERAARSSAPLRCTSRRLRPLC